MRRALTAGALFYSLVGLSWADPIVSNIQVGQLDWINPAGTEFLTNSIWGSFAFDYISDPSQTFFMNVVAAQTGGGNSSWVIRNLPLFGGDAPGGERLGVHFDLGEIGIGQGTDLSSIALIITVESTFRTMTPTGMSSLFGVEEINRFAWSDSGPPEAGAPSVFTARPGSVKNDLPIVPPRPKDRDIRPLEEDPSQCFPGATARSLDWLNRTNSLGMPSMTDMYNDLKTKVANPAGDTVVAKESTKIGLKSDYAKAKSGGAVVTKVYDPLGFVNPINGVTETTPTTSTLKDWLISEFRTEDVELAYYWNEGAHIVTVTRIYETIDGKTMIRYRHDQDQNDNTKGSQEIYEAELKVVDGSYRFGDDKNRVWYVLSESVVPEPGTIVLMASGLSLLALRRFRKCLAVGRTGGRA